MHSKEARRIQRCSLQRFQRRESGSDKSLQFFVQTEAGENVNARGSVRSGKEFDPCFVKHPHEFELFLDKFLARGKVVRTVSLRNFVGKSLPRFALPRRRHIFDARVRAKIAHVQQVSPALPDQRRALPRVIPRQQCSQRSRARFVERRQKLPFCLAALKKIFLRGRTPLKNPDQMLETLHPGFGHFARAHRIRHVPFKGEFLFFRFLGNGQHRLSRD